MQAVKDDAEWELRFPDVSSPEYRKFRGTLEQTQAAGIPIRVYKKVRARDLFNKIVHQAHHNGEPGVLFLDAANRSNPVPHLYQLEATNPCGEQWLGPYENCCLGSVNLAEHCGEEGKVDWEGLRRSVELAVHFLDNVVEVNAYVPAVPQLKEAALKARRIGLGIMGLADLMYRVGVRYGSPEGQEFGSQVMEFIRFQAMRTSVELAHVRGAFPSIKGSIYDFENMIWAPPQPMVAYTHDWGRPELKWNSIKEGILKFGIRNADQTTVAPTGTIATVAGCEGYGCEPVFALACVRHVKTVLLAAADTFRAAAIEQLELWSERTGAQIVRHQSGSDPAAVAFDAIEAGKARNIDLVIIDTAGRLHTKSPLMEELKKVRRVIEKTLPGAPHETLLVIDATTGQNALTQAEIFRNATGVTGIPLTKLDGTAKGGIVFVIRKELGIPIRLIGVGEAVEDLRDFVPKEFVEALFS